MQSCQSSSNDYSYVASSPAEVHIVLSSCQWADTKSLSYNCMYSRCAGSAEILLSSLFLAYSTAPYSRENHHAGFISPEYYISPCARQHCKRYSMVVRSQGQQVGPGCGSSSDLEILSGNRDSSGNICSSLPYARGEQVYASFPTISPDSTPG